MQAWTISPGAGGGLGAGANGIARGQEINISPEALVQIGKGVGVRD